ncbi:hypothetical protein ACQPXM_00045 [Kribbella sp. CA-253562]|uniref:hypothetical protein n=1 Tax=Kribbella sp. CA-253562 TaxID=3239942 RepID=UPI003D90D026
MESLDDVIDAMIADRVIHRHRRKWLIALALVVALVVVLLLTGGFKEHQGRTIPTFDAPTTVQAGRFEYGFTEAKIIREPKTDYSEAKARLQVYFDLKNIDTETKASTSMQGRLLRLVPGGGAELIESNGASCHDELNVVIVHGLPSQPCYAKFDVPADFAEDEVEIAVLAEEYKSDEKTMGADEKPYWHSAGVPHSVVRLKATIETEKDE